MHVMLERLNESQVRKRIVQNEESNHAIIPN